MTINISRHFYTFILFCFTSEGLTKKTTTTSCRNHEIHESSERGIEGITFGLKVIWNLSEFGSNLHNTVNQWPAHLVIPQPNQDDVWRVDPNLQGNKRHQSGSRWVRCPLWPPPPPVTPPPELIQPAERAGTMLHLEESSVCCVGKERWILPTFFRSFPLMWQRRLVPSKHMASRRPFPNILITWAYSGDETGKKQTSSKLCPVKAVCSSTRHPSRKISFSTN